MAVSQEQVMLTLAALAYRGFQDASPGALHQQVVQEALLDGLHTFEPVKGQWKLVWGPATSRQVPLNSAPAFSAFDWSSMYVVRSVESPFRYVVAIRGTNPIAIQDWLFGDLLVYRTVGWPYGNGKEIISGSTALGLAALQGMRSGPPKPANNVISRIAVVGRGAVHAVTREWQRALKGLSGHSRAGKLLIAAEQKLDGLLQQGLVSIAKPDALKDQIRRLGSAGLVKSSDLRPRLIPESEREGELDLLTFLRTQADASADPLEVTVTGHSKGGALAPAVALWLEEARIDGECWDRTGRAKVEFFAFAGPTPGNDAFADRLDAKLAAHSHYVVNTNDIVPQAFQLDLLARIPDLYGDRSSRLKPIADSLIANMEGLNYRHANQGIRQFAGALDSKRSFAGELVHQHLDAYLADLRLLSDEINATTCFV